PQIGEHGGASYLGRRGIASDRPAPAGECQVCPEDDARADDRRDPSARREAPGAGGGRAAPEQRVADETADERADHAEHGGGQPAHVLPARIEGASDESDDETEDQEADDVHAVPPKGLEWNVCTADSRAPACAAGGRL